MTGGVETGRTVLWGHAASGDAVRSGERRVSEARLALPPPPAPGERPRPPLAGVAVAVRGDDGAKRIARSRSGLVRRALRCRCVLEGEYLAISLAVRSSIVPSPHPHPSSEPLAACCDQ